jgi:large subunit ribosomal protein L25
METIVLKAERRKVLGKKVKVLRREGKLPAAIFGHGIETTPITLDMRDASRALSLVGSSTLITIDLEGEKHTALVRERQIDFIYRTLIHVDFQALSMTEKIQTTVSLYYDAEQAPAVETYNAILITALEGLEVESLPGDLPDNIEVDVSSLESIGDGIYVKDITPPEGVEILDDPETLIVVATAPAAEPVEEEEEEEIEEELAAEEPEVIEKGKREEEESEEE